MNNLFEAFELTVVTSSHDQKRYSSSDTGDFVELVLLTEGSGKLCAFASNRSMNLPALIYTPQGICDKFVPDKDARGYVVRFKNEFLPANKADAFAIFFVFGNISLRNVASLDNLVRLFQLLVTEYEAASVDYKSIQYLLLSLLAKVNFVQNSVDAEDRIKDREYLICKEFLKLLEQQFAYNHKVEYYSRQLYIPLRSLNYITTRITGQTVLQLIDARKHIEARKLLADASKSITDVAYELGYDRSYFSRFFHKKSGMTPLQFRQGMMNNVL